MVFLSRMGRRMRTPYKEDQLKQLTMPGLCCSLLFTKTQLPNCHRMVRVPEDPRDRSWVEFFDRHPLSSLIGQPKFQMFSMRRAMSFRYSGASGFSRSANLRTVPATMSAS